MKTVTLQVPMSKKLRDQATRVAKENGFSSFQEVVRLFATKFSKKQITVDLTGVEYLTDEESAVLEKRYKEFLEEEKKGKTYTATSVEEMMEQLTS